MLKYNVLETCSSAPTITKNSACSIPVKKLISSTRMNTYMTISEMLSCSSVLPSEAVKHVQVKSNVFQETVYRRKQYLASAATHHTVWGRGGV